jgi:hypothetical protein
MDTATRSSAACGSSFPPISRADREHVPIGNF